MRKKFRFWSLAGVLLLLAFAIGCKNDDGARSLSDCPVYLSLDGSSIVSCPSNSNTTNVILDREQDLFIWQSMNLYYYWQQDVPNLLDERFDNYDELNTFLNGYASSDELFYEGLVYNQDRFSWIVDDYEELEASFQGESTSFGFEFGLIPFSDSDDIFGYVKYVLPNSPAEQAGIKRGDLFREIDDTQLTRTNYQDLLFGSQSITITLATIQDNIISSTDTKYSITAINIAENPIFQSAIFDDLGGPVVGYLVYNQFINNNGYHSELNDVFANFKSQGITDLVLDLRYNGGGSLLTSRILSSLIYGQATSDDLLGSLVYNEKLSEFGFDISFLESIPVFDSEGDQTGSEAMNRLGLNRIFILTTRSTASASEFVIAGLDPYVTVTQIGTKTTGKNVASITLYDSPSTGYGEKGNDLNSSHKYAIQPIVSQLANSVGFTDYIDGIEPDIEIDELDYLGDFKPLGDPSEPLLAEALNTITGVARVSRREDSGREEIFSSLERNQYTKSINIDGDNKNQLIQHIMNK